MQSTVDAIVARNKQSRRVYAVMLPIAVAAAEIAYVVFKLVARGAILNG